MWNSRGKRGCEEMTGRAVGFEMGVARGRVLGQRGTFWRVDSLLEKKVKFF